jgi:uncharacterized protein (TIGR02265 family)
MILPSRPTAPDSAARVVRPPIPDAEKIVRIPIDFCIKAADPYLTPEIRADLVQEFGAYLGKRQFPALESERLTDFLCSRCLADLPVPEARRLLGYNFLFIYAQTPVMRAMTAALSRASIEWVLRWLPRNFGALHNFGSYSMIEIAPKHWRFTLEDYVGYPDVVRGHLEAGSHNLRNDAQYTYTVVGPRHFYLDITWEQGRLPGSVQQPLP